MTFPKQGINAESINNGNGPVCMVLQRVRQDIQLVPVSILSVEHQVCLDGVVQLLHLVFLATRGRQCCTVAEFHVL